jgi:hypothetical protein
MIRCRVPAEPGRERFHGSGPFDAEPVERPQNTPQRHKVHEGSDGLMAVFLGFFVSFVPLWYIFALLQHNPAVPGRRFSP